MFCNNCEALEETCCNAAKARRELNVSLARLVSKQSETIRALRVALEEQRALVREIMEKNAI